MKTLAKITLLFVVFAFTIENSALGSAACLSVYSKNAVPFPKVTIELSERKVWDLNRELAKDVAIPSRWQSMVENQTHVGYNYTEKTFERQTKNGTKYTVSYHVIEPSSGKYKSTIVLQHGFAESAIYFRTMTKLLVTMGFRVIGMDGANSGHTLLRTIQTRRTFLTAPSPVEDGLALAEVIRMEIPKPEKFILLGHSRGFAVSSLALSTGLFDQQLIQHISSNGYDRWQVDTVIDKAKGHVYNPFSLFPGFAEVTQYFSEQIFNLVRQGTNQMTNPMLRNSVNTHHGMKSSNDVGNSLNHEVTRGFLTRVTMEIADGLKGADTSLPGYDNIALYNPRSDLKLYDNGFGLVNPKVPFPIRPLSDLVKKNTIMVFGKSDHLINLDDSRPITDSIPNKPIVLETDKETGIEATHFLPSQRPFDLVEIILDAYKKERLEKATTAKQ